MRRKIIPYDPILKKRALRLRNDSTKFEIILWHYLKGKQRLGYDFHRQKPIDLYIVDFFCHELILAIELKGATHWEEEVRRKDQIKTVRLNKLGIHVLRFEDEMVFEDLDMVLGMIDDFILKHGHAS